MLEQWLCRLERRPRASRAADRPRPDRWCAWLDDRVDAARAVPRDTVWPAPRDPVRPAPRDPVRPGPARVVRGGDEAAPADEGRRDR